jgi:hypothetical protein
LRQQALSETGVGVEGEYPKTLTCQKRQCKLLPEEVEHLKVIGRELTRRKGGQEPSRLRRYR